MPVVDAETARQLGEAFPDHPFTFEARCWLLRNVAKAWLQGPPDRYEAVVVQPPWRPSEPAAFGADPEAIWSLLQEVAGWECVNVAEELALPLRRVIERELKIPATIYGDVYYLLDQDAIGHHHPSVRRLTEEDADLVDTAPAALHTPGFSSTVAALAGGVAAGGIVGGQLVAVASMSTSSQEFADIGAYTLEGWRGQGLGTAATYLVARELQSRGFRPIWSTGEDNLGSQRVAAKVGFREYGRRQYVVVPALQRSGGYRARASTGAPPKR